MVPMFKQGKIMKKIVCILLTCTAIAQLHGTTLVYNMKIRRAFAAGALLHIKTTKRYEWLLTALPIYYQRTRTLTAQQVPGTVCEHTKSGGSIFNARLLAPHHWWAEVTTGIEKQGSQYSGAINFHAARTGIDDIVAAVGKNFFFAHDNGQCVVYGIAGFPTRRKVTLDDQFDPLVGTRFFSLGGGGEISYSFIRTVQRALIGIIQTRFVHFFNRTWFPILPCDAHIQLGDLTDLVLLLQYHKYKNTIEVGYNPTFFTNQAVLLQTQTIKTDTFVRNSIFANYAHMFAQLPLIKLPGALGAGLTIGTSDLFDTKIFGCWLNITVLV